MTGLEVVVGFLVAWVARKAGRVGKRADAMVDKVLDSGLERVHDLVTAKLGADPALERLLLEAAESGEPSDLTRTRVLGSLQQATGDDPEFARELETAVHQAQTASEQSMAAQRGVAITGSGSGVTIGAITGGTQHFGQRGDPPGPART